MLLGLLVVSAYFLGSIPFGLIIGLLWKGIDIRKVGSGNIGATNMMRVLGPGPGAVVFVLDVMKGFVPVIAAGRFAHGIHWFAVVVGMMAIVGHTLSLFLKFKGGKGVATSLGVLIGLDPMMAALAFGMWILIVLITRYVSVASVIAVGSVIGMMFYHHSPVSYKAFAIVVWIFVLIKHRSNFKRLLEGNEPKFGQRVKTDIQEVKHG